MAGTEIVLNQQMLSDIHAHASSSYPEECCGILIGRFEDGGRKVVSKLKRMENTYEPSERYHRYTIDPLEYLKAEEEAESSGKEIVGIYHSHPNAPAKPSLFDQNHAWPTFSYLVIEVRNGNPVDTRSWVLAYDRTEFAEEGIMNVPKEKES